MPCNVDEYVIALDPTPLPPILKFSTLEINIETNHRKAYDLALELGRVVAWPTVLPDDASLEKAWPTGKLTPQTASRILGYILVEAPVQQAADIIAKEIHSCGNVLGSIDTLYNLADLARFYSLTLFKTFYNYSGKTPRLSSYHSPSGSEDQRMNVEDEMQGDGSDYLKSKEEALARDNHRCVLRRIVDRAYFENLSPSERRDVEDVSVEETNAAHIIPHKLGKGHDKLIKSMSSSTIWTIFTRLADLCIDELQGEQINRVDNIITLSVPMHDNCDRLCIWFTLVKGTSNTYRVEATDRRYLLSVAQNPVTFTSTDPTLPLPNPEYLKLHRACARVLHLSGVQGYIKDAIEREESLKVPSFGRTLTPQTGLDLYEILAALHPTPTPVQ